MVNKKQRKLQNDYPDILKIFFQDVSEASTIPGRQAYLPLTRRVERSRILWNTPMNDVGLKRVVMATERQKKSFQVACETEGILIADEDFVALGDVDEFLDTPSMEFPPRLGDLLAATKSEKCWQVGWRLCYSLSLFPSDMRNNLDALQASEELIQRFCAVHQQYEESLAQLLEGTLRYSIRLAKHYFDDTAHYLDLVQIGYLGIHRALHRFEESKGNHLQTYAASWIFQAISRYKADSSRLIRVPAHVGEKVAEIQEQVDAFEEEYCRSPSDAELIERLQHIDDRGTNKAAKDVDKFRMATATHYPLHKTVRSKTTSTQSI